MKEIKGNLITLSKQAKFDVIGHGCNCFCTMGKGIAVDIKENFIEAWAADQATEYADIKKLGSFTSADVIVHSEDDQPEVLTVINIYSQYHYNAKLKPLDYEALTLALRKINFIHKNKSIGLPLIGAGLAGGNWERIKKIIQTELKNMNVTIVHYEK